MSSGYHNGFTIKVDGIREVNRKLTQAGKDVGQMNDLMHSLGLIVIAHAHPPRKTGELAGTLRAGRGKTKAVVRAGYTKRAPYAGVVHYGDPHRGHKANPFLTDALARSRTKVIAALGKGIDDILTKADLT
ncbi:MAG: hypothetical protein QM677_02475 [Microbacterium sp.]